MSAIDSVPVIDVSKLPDAASLDAIDRACREWGFFQVTNHGVDDDVIRAIEREMRAYFALPLEVKREVERTAENPWGFYDRELTKNQRDWKQIYDCGSRDDPKHPTPWPAGLPGFRDALNDFMDACNGLALRLLAAISTNLGTHPDELAQAFQPSNSSFLRLNYYPVNPDAGDRMLGVNQHTDAGALTLLLQDDVPGLEVERDGVWYLVEPKRGALVINIGDIIQVWSNDRYRAALHRVRASSDRPRFTAPYFLNPRYETYYAPLPTTITPDSPPRYRPIHWGEFRSLRAAGDYQDCGEEVQIDHYRLEPELARHRVHEKEAGHGIH